MDLNDTLQMLRRELEDLNWTIAKLEKLSQSPTPKRRRGRKSMGDEERLVVSARIKRYWANRRQARMT
jgi:hypothetical protein